MSEVIFQGQSQSRSQKFKMLRLRLRSTADMVFVLSSSYCRDGNNNFLFSRVRCVVFIGSVQCVKYGKAWTAAIEVIARTLQHGGFPRYRPKAFSIWFGTRNRKGSFFWAAKCHSIIFCGDSPWGFNWIQKKFQKNSIHSCTYFWPHSTAAIEHDLPGERPRNDAAEDCCIHCWLEIPNH